MIVYRIEINEDQRLILLAAMQHIKMFKPYDASQEEIDLLVQMLEGMPEYEKNDPRILLVRRKL